MTAQITSIRKVSLLEWRYDWTGTAPYRLYSDGVYLGSAPTDDTSIVLTGDDAFEPPALEVLDSTQLGDPEGVTWPPALILQWRTFEGAYYYQVQQYVGAAWIDRRVIREDGAGYYWFDTGPLADVTSANWRVKAYDRIGNSSNVSFEGFVVRNPPPPSIDLSYTGAGSHSITVEAR